MFNTLLTSHTPALLIHYSSALIILGITLYSSFVAQRYLMYGIDILITGYSPLDSNKKVHITEDIKGHINIKSTTGEGELPRFFSTVSWPNMVNTTNLF